MKATLCISLAALLVGCGAATPKEAKRPNPDAPAPTRLRLNGEGTFQPKEGESRKFEVAADGQAPSELTLMTKEVTLEGEIVYKEADGTERKLPVKLNGSLTAKQDEAALPFSFVDLQAGIVLYLPSSNLADHSTLPFRVKASAGVIPEDHDVRFGASIAFTRAAFDNDSTLKDAKRLQDGRLADAKLRGHTPFDSFEFGFFGKYFKEWTEWGGRPLFFGFGAEVGPAFFERVVARVENLDDCAATGRCMYTFPAAVEAFGSIPLEVAWGKRAEGGPHLTLQPTLYTAHSGAPVFAVPITIGFEF